MSANTHTAVDELTERLRLTLPYFRKASAETGFRDNTVIVLRIRDPPSGQEEIAVGNDQLIRTALADHDVVVCGSVNEMLKLGKNLTAGLAPEWKEGVRPDRRRGQHDAVPGLPSIGHDGSPDGEIMLAGDHMQLSPITSHDWENETREQMVRLTPHESAYVTVKRLCAKCGRNALRQSDSRRHPGSAGADPSHFRRIQGRGRHAHVDEGIPGENGRDPFLSRTSGSTTGSI